MILSDVIPLCARTSSKPYKEAENLVIKLATGAGFDTMLVRIAVENPGASVPKRIIDLMTVGSVIAQTPQARLADIRRIADLLGFLIVPFEYVSKNAISQENAATQNCIKSFISKTGQWFQSYVLAPASHYDLRAHASSGVDHPVYCAKAMAHAMDAIPFVVSALRSVQDDLRTMSWLHHAEVQCIQADAERKIAALGAEIKKSNDRVAAVEARHTREDNAKANRRYKKEKLAGDLMCAYWEFRSVEQNVDNPGPVSKRPSTDYKNRAYEALREAQCEDGDPILIGIPKGSTVNSDCNVLIGPCWGPDADDVVFASVGLQKVSGQREFLAKKAEMFIRGNRQPPTSNDVSPYWFVNAPGREMY